MSSLTVNNKKAYNKLATTKTVVVGFGDSNDIHGVHTPTIRLGVFLCLNNFYMAVCVGRPQGLLGSVNTSSPTLRTLPPKFGDFGGNGFISLFTESQMAKNINGQSRPQFNTEQINLVDNISLSLEKLDGVLFFLEQHQEAEHQYSVEYPHLSTFETRVLTILYMANEIQRNIKSDFEKLIGGAV
ncbi:MAG: hypothetical protein KGV56_06675 [Gammaproteobacteria bacterium]|nr:hypothetical protein [Gammaproteobacteria bacterium]